MFEFAAPRPSRKPSLTPMIDVVFLLLVFFMLASRFGQDFALPLQTAGADAPYQGPPRLIDVSTGGLRLNGFEVTRADLAAQLKPLMDAPTDTVILRPNKDATLQHLVDIIDTLRAAGLTQIIIVETQP